MAINAKFQKNYGFRDLKDTLCVRKRMVSSKRNHKFLLKLQLQAKE